MFWTIKNYIKYYKEIPCLFKERRDFISAYYSSTSANHPILDKINYSRPVVISKVDNFRELTLANKNSKNIDEWVSELDKLSNFDDTISFLERNISSNNFYLLSRLKELKVLCDLEADCDIELKSLKSMLLFIFIVQSFSKASLILNESGYLQLSWRKDRNSLMTLRFQDDYILDYVIFIPSSYIQPRIILNGSMNVLDFIDYMHNLKLAIHK